MFVYIKLEDRRRANKIMIGTFMDQTWKVVLNMYFLDSVICLDLSARRIGKCGLPMFYGRRGKGFNEHLGGLCNT